MRAPLTIMAVLACCSSALSVRSPRGLGAREADTPPRRSPRRRRRSRAASRRCAACASTRIPRPVAVTPAQARREGLEDLDRSYPAARRRADEEVLKLLGPDRPGVDLRDGLGLGLRRGRRRLLRPAHEAAADRVRRRDPGTRC